ncbi:TIGR03986 family type III CRISPR-associated RAMP protein [Anabaena sp. WFMT]|uniref:TIGR03986 family type III CRISPR-associated RAMP protein n=1 Tax=Anabaena sp. WFMT TaxID=3449730 RepID=UPI003F27FAAF
MNPKHISKVPDERKAIAPYNFVELPEKVVEVSPDSLQQKNRYCENRYTGRIECTLTTESPLYIRCGLTKEEFECGAESKDLPDFFYTNPLEKSTKPVIPGSSLRGMLRNLVEIVSFSKIDRVSDQKHFFFRAVAAQKDDPLGREYKNLLKEVKAGYLVREGVNWHIKPAKSINNSPFIWVKERDLSRIHSLIKMNQQNYHPQYINVSFGDTLFKSPRRFTTQVSANQSLYPHKGILITSGNMLESSNNSENLHRRNHCIVAEINNDVDALKINDDAIQYYRSSLTEFQKQKPFDKDFGVLEQGRPIFYCETQNGQIEVTLFGHCPNFRIPYSPNRDGVAASAVNFIPENIAKSDIIDLADAIFGFVRGRDRDKDTYKNSKSKRVEALASRVSIEDAICEKTVSDDIWLTGNFDETITPKILSSPKPTTFQHYLVQKSAEKNQLKHYANKPATNNETGETVIRGHKLYWHKGSNPDIEHPDGQNATGTQITKIKPIKAGILFKFNIHFENLSNVELGTILWVLKVAAEPEYCLSLGMGKPLGMGAVKISHQLHLSDRTSRYSSLFHEKQWLTGEQDQSNTASKHSDCIKAFEKYILDNIHDDDNPQGCKATKLEEIPRIQMLLAMLRCDNPPLAENTRYMTMTIEANEYKNRPILPTPLQIMDISDNRRCQNKDIVIIKLRQDKKSEKFQVGQIVDARVTKINGSRVTYEITTTMQRLTEKEPKKAAFLQEEETVKVKITALKEDGNIKSVKLYDR